jgi:glucuronate isomerase
MERLAAGLGVEIARTEDVIRALERRVDFFHRAGCRLSDHALDTVPFAEMDLKKADAALAAGLRGEAVNPEAHEHYQTALLVALGGMYHARGWALQYLMNALRSVNSRMLQRFGPDTGFDSIGDAPVAEKLVRLLDAQERSGALPKTILYTLNPAANYILAAAAGSFQGGIPGKIQFGSAWWFCDQKEGMLEQMKALAGLGLLSRFVGMLTDSAPLSATPGRVLPPHPVRPDRRLGGERRIPAGRRALSAIVRGVCYENARRYFGIEL